MGTKLFFLAHLFLLSASLVQCDSTLETYIVHVLPPDDVVLSASSPQDLEDYYRSFLPQTATASVSSESRLVFTYREVMSGFAAKLTAEELEQMRKKDGFLHAYPDVRIPLLTTHTPDLLGLPTGLWRARAGPNLGEGVIIGMIDTGILPAHPSFDDKDMPPPPSKWKGSCLFGKKYCNNKIIGARSFVGSSDAPPVDEEGHGTHTAATAGGAFAAGANYLGFANGTAAGVAPRAHLAIYRVCEPGFGGCSGSAMLKGVDTAVADGVDVLSISIGGNPVPFHSDAIAIGAFGAVAKGVFVSCAAGNYGPSPYTLSNEAPWILTVAAATTDRSIRSTVRLGSGVELHGQTLYQPTDFPPKPLKLVQPIGGRCNGTVTGVEGNVVFCYSNGLKKVWVGETFKEAGAAAIIVANNETNGHTTITERHVLPGASVGNLEWRKIEAYFKSTTNPTASISFQGTVLGDSPAPTVAAFSSRGPSQTSPLILKPDVAGPGVNIIAAWNRMDPPINPEVDTPAAGTGYFYKIISGTSMATPHLSGVAALLKKAHPHWSPAAIKSAIITSSDTLDNQKAHIRNEVLKPARFIEMGAGHVNPTKAADPGLVYDVVTSDYIPYLCGLTYTDEEVSAVVRQRVSCKTVGKISESDLNYPSIAVSFPRGETVVTVSRTVTNVGPANSTYTATMDKMDGVSVAVAPTTLQFSRLHEKKKFNVTFTKTGEISDFGSDGTLKWVSRCNIVRSPLFVM